jgi:histidyl-tRNA synthetase
LPPDRLEIAIAAENVERETDAAEMVSVFRQAGFVAEAFITGSPRKRYDKARKSEPAILISFDVREGQKTQSWLSTDPTIVREEEALQLLEDRWKLS